MKLLCDELNYQALLNSVSSWFNRLMAFKDQNTDRSFAHIFVSSKSLIMFQGELKKTLVEETMPKFCDFFEMRLCENDGGSGFFVGSEVGII